MKTVLYFQAKGNVSARQKLEGVYAYGREHGWEVQVVDPVSSAGKVAKLLAFWSPDGALVECGSGQNLFEPEIFGKTPVVFVDRTPSTLRSPAFCVMHDSVATAQVAARELIALNLNAFAYVPWPEPRYWSEMRERGFADALKLNGRGLIRFAGKVSSSDVHEWQRELAAWLQDLPKPIGVFAANDFTAAQVAAAAGRLGLGIPEDVALVGVDNDELLCENVNPTLSSVMPDFRAAGGKAAALLDRRMENPRLRPTTETFGPLKLVRRASSHRAKRIDREVLAALDLIRREACTGLTARQVVATFPCSRRMAEIRFRAVTGHSVLDEIQSVRREKALELLKDPALDRNAVANFCGYASGNALMNFLRKTRKDA